MGNAEKSIHIGAFTAGIPSLELFISDPDIPLNPTFGM